KRSSPSKGAINPRLDPAQLAQAYARGGAAAISVLTDRVHFGGSLDDLRAARAAVSLPVLRKDFIVTEFQVREARAHGADAILLIAAAAPLATLGPLRQLARELGMAVLFEVHEESELDAARACEPAPRHGRGGEGDPRRAARAGPAGRRFPRRRARGSDPHRRRGRTAGCAAPWRMADEARTASAPRGATDALGGIAAAPAGRR